MNYYQLICESFHRTIEAVSLSVDTLAPALEQACELMTQALLSDNKILCCGNGSGAAVCALLTSHFNNQLEQERPALPMTNLSTDASVISGLIHSGHAQAIYARPLRALGAAGDVLIIVAGAQDEISLMQAVQSAKERDMHVILISGTPQSELSGWLDHNDTELCTHADSPAQIIELQIMTINCLTALIDRKLFGNYP